MQAYANVATAPIKKTTQGTKRTYWEFRAAESSKGEDKDPTWYTVRVFKDELPQLAKGDFVVFTGKLKQDLFMSREGRPMGVLTVMAFQLAKVSKDKAREELVAAAAQQPDRRAGRAEEAKPMIKQAESDRPSEGGCHATAPRSQAAGASDFVWLVGA